MVISWVPGPHISKVEPPSLRRYDMNGRSQMQGGKKMDFVESDKCKPVLMRLLLAWKPYVLVWDLIKGAWQWILEQVNTFQKSSRRPDQVNTEHSKSRAAIGAGQFRNPDKVNTRTFPKLRRYPEKVNTFLKSSRHPDLHRKISAPIAVTTAILF